MSIINIPASAQGAFQGNMNQGSSAVELPFPAPAFFIVNGEEKLSALKNFLFHGGFACNIDNIKKATEFWDCPTEIPGLQQTTMTPKGQPKYEALTSRSVMFAPIGMRQFSEIKDANNKKRRVPPFTKGASPALQVLGVLGYRKPDKSMESWAPIMLTAKGWQVNHLQKAIKSWQDAIKPFVKELVQTENDTQLTSVLNLFWMYIGTFGQEPKFESHGESVITPVISFIPEDLNKDKVANMYVGDQMAEFMADISGKAQEWLKVFANMPAAVTAVVSQGEYVPEEPPPPEDDIPF